MQDEFFTELIDSGLQGEAYKGLNQKPWVEGHAALDDFLKANRYLTYLFARKTGDGRGEEENDRQRFFPAEVFNEYKRLVKTLVRDDKIFISDRKLVKLYVFRVRLALLGRRREQGRPSTTRLFGRKSPGNRTFAGKSPRVPRRRMIRK